MIRRNILVIDDMKLYGVDNFGRPNFQILASHHEQETWRDAGRRILHDFLKRRRLIP